MILFITVLIVLGSSALISIYLKSKKEEQKRAQVLIEKISTVSNTLEQGNRVNAVQNGGQFSGMPPSAAVALNLPVEKTFIYRNNMYGKETIVLSEFMKRMIEEGYEFELATANVEGDHISSRSFYLMRGTDKGLIFFDNAKRSISELVPNSKFKLQPKDDIIITCDIVCYLPVGSMAIKVESLNQIVADSTVTLKLKSIIARIGHVTMDKGEINIFWDNSDKVKKFHLSSEHLSNCYESIKLGYKDKARTLDPVTVFHLMQDVLNTGKTNILLEGIGGTGKTRLIEAIAASMADLADTRVIFCPGTLLEEFLQSSKVKGTGDKKTILLVDQAEEFLKSRNALPTLDGIDSKLNSLRVIMSINRRDGIPAEVFRAGRLLSVEIHPLGMEKAVKAADWIFKNLYKGKDVTIDYGILKDLVLQEFDSSGMLKTGTGITLADIFNIVITDNIKNFSLEKVLDEIEVLETDDSVTEPSLKENIDNKNVNFRRNKNKNRNKNRR